MSNASPSPTRRRLLQLGLGALATALVRPAARAAAAVPRTETGPSENTSGSARSGRAKACIVVFLHGGASQIDTFDPKPGTDTGGPFAAIPTALPGVRLSEHLPRLAQRLDRTTLIRSLTMREGNHERARYLMHTGSPPQGGTPHPSFGAWTAEGLARGPLPGHVAIGTTGHGAGLLGAQRGPFVIRDATRPVRDLEPSTTLTDARRADRVALWHALQDDFARRHPSPLVEGHAEVVEQARAMMADGDATGAFDLEREPAAMRERYGRDGFGQGCLMARRLVEAGVPFVEVGLPGWDTHADNFDRVQRLSGPLDRGLGALLDDLEARGLLDETLVVCMGDFGRSPRINARGGRDHHPACSSVLMAGGGTPRGQVIGVTDREGYTITERPVSVQDLLRTMAVTLGLDPNETRTSPAGRPLTMVDGGRVLPELV